MDRSMEAASDAGAPPAELVLDEREDAAKDDAGRPARAARKKGRRKKGRKGGEPREPEGPGEAAGPAAPAQARAGEPLEAEVAGPDGPGGSDDGEEPGEGGGGEPEDDGRLGPGAKLSDEELFRSVAALVFASPEPLSTAKLVELLKKPQRDRLEQALEALGERLAASGLALELKSIAGGWQVLTSPDTAEVVGRLFEARRVERLSPAALETLAVVAYRQPVTKAEIEAIRGVQAGPLLRSLVDRGLVRVTGRADVPGHPLQYGTTRQFLDRFGLDRLGDLPRDGELARD